MSGLRGGARVRRPASETRPVATMYCSTPARITDGRGRVTVRGRPFAWPPAIEPRDMFDDRDTDCSDIRDPREPRGTPAAARRARRCRRRTAGDALGGGGVSHRRGRRRRQRRSTRRGVLSDRRGYLGLSRAGDLDLDRGDVEVAAREPRAEVGGEGVDVLDLAGRRADGRAEAREGADERGVHALVELHECAVHKVEEQQDERLPPLDLAARDRAEEDDEDQAQRVVADVARERHHVSTSTFDAIAHIPITRGR